ncbi:hypothetical protein CQ12_18640 [Bradyrhizobium jicamae]|uniref:EF-hand domain-containing protein n=1 Tax=Bradyrhizobium jicamae TaxID=280332 RepID=A0A0R3L969_9BRAD|nr:hypothetical protein CQ12_18640 [Bradyrhizobium jicamae]
MATRHRLIISLQRSNARAQRIAQPRLQKFEAVDQNSDGILDADSAYLADTAQIGVWPSRQTNPTI